MPQLFIFKDLIREYSVTFEVETEATEGTYDDLGEYVEGVPATYTSKGALVPLASRVVYESGGRLDEMDRQLIKTGEPIPLGTHVLYKGRRYRVESWTNHGDYGDFETYLLKHVSNEAST